jgi:hypothetical protein
MKISHAIGWLVVQLLLFFPVHSSPPSTWLSTHHSHSANLWAQNPQNPGHHQIELAEVKVFVTICIILKTL